MRPQRTAVTDVLFGAVIPGAGRNVLATPTAPHRLWIESTAGRAIVFLAWPPKSVSAFFRARVHQCPRAQARGIAQPQILGGFFGEVQTVIEDRPASHLRHI